MAEFARVTNLDALRHFKAALQSFQEDCTVALSEATSDAQRGLYYISSDCKAHWARELKKRTEKLNQAKAELFKKQMESNDTRTSAVVERKHVQRWENAVAQAETKLVNIKKWSMAMEREFMLFKAGVQGMSNIVAGELPNATARIERMIKSLEEYIHLAAPTDAPMTTGSSADGDQQREEASSAGGATQVRGDGPAPGGGKGESP